MTQSSRLDALLLARGHYASRSRAADAVRRGAVRVNGAVVTKPGAAVASNAAIELSDPASAYVSRGALKLIAALDRFAIDPSGLICLDLGASTGGFTQVLLERGAARVHAIDVGHGQLVETLRADSRVHAMDGFNARDLKPEHLGETVDLIVADVSFISLRLVLLPAMALAKPGARLVALVKPQFEVGRDALGKGGIVRNAAAADAALQQIAAFVDGVAGWRVLGTMDSPIPGGDGNREFLLAAAFSGPGTDS